MEKKPQTFENHVKYVPTFHMGVFPIFVINLGWAIYRAARSFSGESGVSLLLAVGLVLLFFNTRAMVMTVQDRVIRLEMQLRLERLLPADLKPRIDDFSPGQLVALRFASDAELPELARKVLADGVADRKTIKRMIKVWNPDYLRA